MAKMKRETFVERIEERKQEEEARKANLPSNYATRLLPQDGTSVFFAVVVVSEEEAQDLDNYVYERNDIIREVKEADKWSEVPRYKDRILVPAIVPQSDTEYGYNGWVLGDNEMIYFQLPSEAIGKPMDAHIADLDTDFHPLFVTPDGTIHQREKATAFKMHRSGRGVNTNYSILTLAANKSTKYIPETVDVAPQDFDEFEQSYNVWQQEIFNKLSGNESNDSENTPDSL